MNNNIYSVSQVNRYIKNIFENDILLRTIRIKGEITNFKAHYTGHLYFTLKDNTSNIKCVMFKSQAQNLKFNLADGMSIVITGQVTSFERDGAYQVYAKEIEPNGIGALHLAFEQLKEKLEKEGLFRKEHKKAIPFIPKRVGVITSKTGAVISDIINVSTRRFDNVNILLYPAAVQGQDVGATVSEGIKVFNNLKNVDVIIVARGGGSFEDLFGFNDERIARAIYDSEIPVVSAVGHQTDFTICDFVADLRAPTPSAAAELVYPDKIALVEKIALNKMRLRKNIIKLIELKRQNINNIKSKLTYRGPKHLIDTYRMIIDNRKKTLIYKVNSNLENSKNELVKKTAKLEGLSPLKTLSRGYSIVTDINNKAILDSNELEKGQELKIILDKGNVTAIVK